MGKARRVCPLPALVSLAPWSAPRHFLGKKVGTRDASKAPSWVPHWLCLGSAGLWAESLPLSSDRCANFPSREAWASGDEFLGPYGEIFLWNKEREALGRSCSCHCSLGDIVGGLRWPRALTCVRQQSWVLNVWSLSAPGVGVPSPTGGGMGHVSICSGRDRENGLPGRTCSGQ